MFSWWEFGPAKKYLAPPPQIFRKPSRPLAPHPPGRPPPPGIFNKKALPHPPGASGNSRAEKNKKYPKRPSSFGMGVQSLMPRLSCKPSMHLTTSALNDLSKKVAEEQQNASATSCPDPPTLTFALFLVSFSYEAG